MIAGLPMYDWPEVRSAMDGFWTDIAVGLAGAGLDVPSALTRDKPARELWQDPDLILGQTCGLPFVSGLCGEAEVFARPDFGVDGADGGDYSSALVCRRGEETSLANFHGRVAAINEYGSQSGCNALADSVGTADFFSAVRVTGAHRDSALAVARGDADIAAIDAVAWDLFKRFEAQAAIRLDVIGWTRTMPALPYIVGSRHTHRAALLRSAVSQACSGGPGLPKAIMPATADDYAPIRTMARQLRGWRLAPMAPPL